MIKRLGIVATEENLEAHDQAVAAAALSNAEGSASTAAAVVPVVEASAPGPGEGGATGENAPAQAAGETGAVVPAAGNAAPTVAAPTTSEAPGAATGDTAPTPAAPAAEPPVVATEAIQESKPWDQYASQSISMEEEALLMDGAREDAADTGTDLSEAERIIDVANALEDLAIVASEIKEATPEQIALVENAGQLAVAGTDVSPEEVVPALEEFVGTKINVNSILKVAKAIWESIVKFIKQVWQQLQDYFKKIFPVAAALKKRLNAQREQIKWLGSSNSQPSTAPVTIIGGAKALSIAGKTVTNPQQLQKGLSDLEDAAKYVFGSYTETVLERGDIIADAIDAFDMQNSQQALVNLKNLLKRSSFADVPGPGKVSAAMYPGFVARIGFDLLGSVHLVSKQYSENADDTSVLGSMDRYRNSGVFLDNSRNHAAGNLEIAPLSADTMLTLVDQAIAVVEVLEDYANTRRGELEKASARVQKASADATNMIHDHQEGGESAIVQSTVADYRAMVNFNTAMARWARDPAVGFATSALNTLRAIWMLNEKSIAAHPAPAAA